jgi:hypothetical protein
MPTANGVASRAASRRRTGVPSSRGASARYLLPTCCQPHRFRTGLDGSATGPNRSTRNRAKQAAPQRKPASGTGSRVGWGVTDVRSRTSGVRGYACARMHHTSSLPPDSDGARESAGLQQSAVPPWGLTRGSPPPASARLGGPCIGGRPSGVAASTGRRACPPEPAWQWSPQGARGQHRRRTRAR